MSINQLFRRLSIRAKLLIAFVFLAVVPLVIMATLGVRHTIRQVRALARTTLENDLAVARTQTERALAEVERDVAYLTSHVLGPLIAQPPKDPWEEAGLAASEFLSFKPALFRVKVIDVNGRVILVVYASGSEVPTPAQDEEGLYYALRASSLQPGEHLLLPVELRRVPEQAGATETVPAIAILNAVRSPDGSVLGAVVGEAHASALFAPLEASSPQFGGVTGLIDSEGLYLYHSTRKRDWSSLLALRSEVDIRSELAPEAVEVMLSGQTAETMPTTDQQIVSYVRLPLAGTGIPPLVLYRLVPLSALEAGVRSFLGMVGIGGLVVLSLVLGLGTLAAHQFTQPIYQLRQGARRLARGESEGPLEITTRDELEDLANDFSVMARSLVDQRQKLEELVRERTHALREVHAELAGILEHSADAIIGTDMESRVRVWNDGAKSLFGYTATEVHGRPLDDLLLPSGDSWLEEAAFLRREAGAQGAVVNYQTRRVTRDGTVNPVSLTQSIIRGTDGQPIGYSVIIRDTRMQARLQEQMHRSESLATVSVMAAGLAHELGNPLAVIGNRIECMEQEIKEHREGEFLNEDLVTLREHVRRLDGVIRDMLSLAREGAGDDESVALNAVAARVVRILERTYVARKVRLETDFDDSLPTLTGSEKAIETVCVNLMMNALDATPREGTVSVRTLASDGGGAVDLEVEDTGSGIPAELRHRIFEPFFTTKKAGRGTGLGLAVCRSIVERHGGSITVQSQPGSGSRFTVSLPVRRFEI